jgi:predicted TPR repeat methyltransferase
MTSAISSSSRTSLDRELTSQTAAEQLLRESIAQHRAGEHAAAEAGYRRYLADHPRSASALHFLGLLRSHQGRNAEAIPLMVQALELDPEYVDAWSNLGIAYYQERDLERAEKCHRRALALNPQFVNAWSNLGMTLRARDAHEEAVEAWQRALALSPHLRSVAIPLGQLLYRLDRLEEALALYRRWHEAAPDDPIPVHMLAALGGEGRPERASDGYIRSTFDDFADSFDQSLERLRYRAPELLCEALSRAAAGRQRLAAVDLGCGTGLCGPLLRPLAGRLIGVDLSPKMLAKAAARGAYDQLNCAELTQWLAGCGERFDAAVAADVLCYFGELAEVFGRVREVLAPDGRFACSLEALKDEGSGPPFALLPHGRYQHARGHVEATLAAAGLRIIELSQAVLRYERGEPVVGHVILAARAD